MKKTSFLFISAIFILFGSSCKKYLAINTNPNQATTSTPEAILPQAITYTASNISSFNDYGAELGGFAANAGGYGGFGSNWTYDFGPNDYSGLWSSTFDVLNDLQVVLNVSEGDELHAYYNAVARIMKVYNYELLVDTYNSVPYFNALKGSAGLTPKYDDPKAIYLDMAVQLDSAITTIEGVTDPSEVTLNKGTDPMFGGDMIHWIQFANTLKLRLIVRASAVITFPDATFDNTGFLTTDAIVNPGYAKINGQQNPSWNSWVQSYTGGNGNRAWMPATFALSFYDGTNILDSFRGRAIYLGYPKTNNNQLGDGLTGVPSAPATTNAWYSDWYGTTASPGNDIGVMKGLNMGEPLMLAAESYFLQAEANLRGIITSGATTDSLFNSGILASFNYLYLLPDDATLGAGLNPAKDAAQYMADNAGNFLVNFNLATTAAQQEQAIITQKYIALNFINSQEAWNEYRRTLYPAISTLTSDPTQSFASTLSQSTRPDHLPSRILYPASEYSYNAANVPTGVSPYSSLIFWAHQ